MEFDRILDEDPALEVSYKQLRQYFKETFYREGTREPQPQDYFFAGTVLNRLNVPTHFFEQFIDKRTVKYAALSPAGMLGKYEEWYKVSKGMGETADNFPQMTKFFEKWAIEKADNEQYYYARSAIELAQRNPSVNNPGKYFIVAAIHTFDKKYIDFKSALEYYEYAEKALEKSGIPDELRVQFDYTLKLYKGFLDLKKRDIQSASENFGLAISKKENPLNGWYYKAVTDCLLGKYDSSLDYLKKVVEFDLHRLNYAADNNMAALFGYVTDKAAMYNLVNHPEFSPMTAEIKNLLEGLKQEDATFVTSLADWMKRLKNIDEATPYIQGNENLRTSLAFLAQLSDHYRSDKNQIILMIGKKLRNRVESLIQQIIKMMEEEHETKVTGQLGFYDQYREQEETKLKEMREGIDSGVNSMKESLEAQIRNAERKFDNNIADLERKIESVSNSKEYDPSQSFLRVVFGTLIASLIFIIIGGTISIVGGSGGSSMGSKLTKFLVSGMWWGVAVFAIGLFWAIVSSTSKVVEGNKKKREYVKGISTLKSKKKRELQKLQTETESKQKTYAKSLDAKMEDAKAKIEGIIKDKKEREDQIRGDYNAIQNTLKEKLQKVME